MTSPVHKANAAPAGSPYLHNKGATTMTIGRFVAGIGAVLLLFGCLPGSMSHYRPDPEFVDLYAELKLASLALNQDLDKASEIRRVILAQHGMTPAEFHEHFMQLADHPEAWRPFQEQVVARIDALQPKPDSIPEGVTHGQ